MPRPRGTAVANPADLPTTDLLVRLIGHRHGNQVCETIAAYGSIRRLAAVHPAELRERGLTPAALEKLTFVFEVARRSGEEEFVPGQAFQGPHDVYAHFRERLAAETVEFFIAVLLDNKHRKLRDVVVSMGALTASLVHPRDVFARVMRDSAAGPHPCPQSSVRRPDAVGRGPGDHPAPPGRGRAGRRQGLGPRCYRPRAGASPSWTTATGEREPGGRCRTGTILRRTREQAADRGNPARAVCTSRWIASISHGLAFIARSTMATNGRDRVRHLPSPRAMNRRPNDTLCGQYPEPNRFEYLVSRRSSTRRYLDATWSARVKAAFLAPLLDQISDPCAQEG